MKLLVLPLDNNNKTDTLVHEFCKLFGVKGVPEYGIGAVSFPNYLAIAMKSVDNEDGIYYEQCKSVTLDRQVGSRYFVTAANAVRLLFLRKAASIIDLRKLSYLMNGHFI